MKSFKQATAGIWRKTGLIALMSFALSAHAGDSANSSGVGIELLTPDGTALAGTSSASFTLVRTGATNSAVEVSLVIGGTASNGVDYATIPNLVNIPAGALAVDIPINPLVNVDRRGNKTVTLALSTNSLYTLSKSAQGKVKIVDDIYNLQAPSIAILNPTNGTVFHTPGILPLQVEAETGSSVLKQVSYYANDEFIGRATNSPWNINWTNPPVGNWVLFARAVDMAGKSALSQPINFTSTNARPLVSILSPTNGTVFSAPQDVSIQVQFSDADDSIKEAAVFGDGKPLGIVKASPAALTWTNVSSGQHTVLARVRDSLGQQTTVKSQFTITESHAKITVTSPKSGASFQAPADVLIQAGSSSTVSAIEFWFDNRKVGQSTNAPYQLTVPAVKAGFHTLYAVGVENSGKRDSSGAVYISVSK